MLSKRQFEQVLKNIILHCDYSDEMVTVEECSKYNVWTPCDMIMREYYQNGCISAPMLLGITSKRCQDAFDYIQNHKEELIQAHYINERGINNYGRTLWSNYDL